MRHADRARGLRRAHDLLLPGVPDGWPRAEGPPAVALTPLERVRSARPPRARVRAPTATGATADARDLRHGARGHATSPARPSRAPAAGWRGRRGGPPRAGRERRPRAPARSASWSRDGHA